MTTMTMTNKATMKQEAKTGGCSLKERFKKYMEAYGAQITCGMMALQGDCNAYRTYAEMTRTR